MSSMLEGLILVPDQLHQDVAFFDKKVNTIVGKGFHVYESLDYLLEPGCGQRSKSTRIEPGGQRQSQHRVVGLRFLQASSKATVPGPIGCIPSGALKHFPQGPMSSSDKGHCAL